MLNTKQQDNRKFQRIAETLPVRFRFSDRADSLWQEAETRNISEGGIFITKSLKQQQIGNVVHLDLQLHEKGASLRIICQLAWVKHKDETVRGVGLKILQIEGKQKHTYLTYISKRVKPEVEKKTPRLKFSREPLYKLYDKERRSFQILDYIRRFGPVSKADIAKQVNLNAVTTSKFIDQFFKAGLIFDCGLDLSSGGRRAQLVEFNPDFGLILGIEVNKKQGFIHAIIADMGLKIVIDEKQSIEYGEDIGAAIVSLASNIKLKLGGRYDQVLGVGIGLDSRGDEEEIADYIEGELDLPVVVEESFRLESFAQAWITRELADKSIIYIHSAHLLSLILEGDIYKPDKEIEGKAELTSLGLGDKVLALIEFLGPDIVYIAKRVEKQLPKLRAEIKEQLRTANKEQAGAIKVLGADLDEAQAVALGAASLAIREVFIGVCR